MHQFVSFFSRQAAALFYFFLFQNTEIQESHAVARKPRDVACFFLRPVTLYLLLASAYERSRPAVIAPVVIYRLKQTGRETEYK